MRYYEQRYPEVDELVMVQVCQIAEMGAYVKLVSIESLTHPHPHLLYLVCTDDEFGSGIALVVA